MPASTAGASLRGMAGIGHNKGPSIEPGASWRRYAWGRARASLIGARLPIEILRLRVARAEALGLAYPTYARVLMGSGRDIVGFLFTCDALGLRLQRRLEIPEAVRDKLAGVVGADLLAFAPEGEDPGLFRQELTEVSGLAISASGPTPQAEAPPRKIGAAVRTVLAEAGLPGKGVVLIGARTAEEAWVTPGRLGSFLVARDYFSSLEPARS
ncbi:MAG: hypothetical protein AAGA32_13945 [Pseudomonadota bacterium]